MVKNLPANTGDTGSIPESRRSSEGGNGNLPSILAWKIPWTEEPVRQQSMGRRAGHTLVCTLMVKQDQTFKIEKVWQCRHR